MITFKTLQKWLPRGYGFLPYHFRPDRALPPAQVFFEVTYRCNLRCEMCHYLEIIEHTETRRAFKQELSAEGFRQVIERLPRFSLITFTGGEAFMKQDALDLLGFAARRHKVHVITNGTLLTPRTVDFLVERRVRRWWSPGLFYLGVSLEGGESLHDRITQVPGSFRKTTEGLERLMAARGPHRFPLVHLTCVINRGTVGEMTGLYDYAERMNVDVMNFVLHNPAQYNHYSGYDHEAVLRRPAPPVEPIEPKVLRDVLDQLEDKSRRHRTRLRFSPNGITRGEIIRYYSNKSRYTDYRCYVPWSKMAVSAYGDLFSCPHVPLGNVASASPEAGWSGERARRFRRMLKREKIFPGCLGCCQSEYVGP